jgi:hypothetical protein
LVQKTAQFSLSRFLPLPRGRALDPSPAARSSASRRSSRRGPMPLPPSWRPRASCVSAAREACPRECGISRIPEASRLSSAEYGK